MEAVFILEDNLKAISLKERQDKAGPYLPGFQVLSLCPA